MKHKQQSFWGLKPVRSIKRSSPTPAPQRKQTSNPFWNTKPMSRDKYKTGMPVYLFGDKDRDGVMNVFDCRPRNKRMQGKLVQNIPISQAKYVTVYHGTQKKYTPKIIEKGFRKHRGHVYVSPDPVVALTHAEYGPEKIKKHWARTFTPEEELAVDRDRLKALKEIIEERSSRLPRDDEDRKEIEKDLKELNKEYREQKKSMEYNF